MLKLDQDRMSWASRIRAGQQVKPHRYLSIFWGKYGHIDGCEHCAKIRTLHGSAKDPAFRIVKKSVRAGVCLGLCRDDRDAKEAAIVALAQIVIRTVPQPRRKKLRDKFNKKKSRDYIGLGQTPCFICKETAHHRHHLLQIQHGGENRAKNQVYLCRTCHRRIHSLAAKTA